MMDQGFQFSFMNLQDEKFYWSCLVGSIFVAICMLVGTTLVVAPYGRHVRRGFGPVIGVREGWIVMESPALWAMVAFFSLGQNKLQSIPLILLRFHQVHYFHRVIIYPLRMKVQGKGMPISVAASAIAFNIYNSYLQGRWLSQYGSYADTWLTSPQFVIGCFLFVTGLAINIWADSVLLSLRVDDHDRSYKIPRGGLYEYICCPNYFGETVEWLGWAVLTWSPAGLAFFAMTLANLLPRAIAHHKWYLSKFNDYPCSRKIFVPFVF